MQDVKFENVYSKLMLMWQITGKKVFVWLKKEIVL